MTSDNVGAAALAAAIADPGADVGAASFQAVPPSGTANGIGDGLAGFPTNGSTFAIITSGNASLAGQPNIVGNSGASDGGAPVSGNSDHDVCVLHNPLTVPLGANCLSLDFKFLSEEYSEFAGSAFNDALIAELDTSDRTTSGSTISAPHHFAFDSLGNGLSINAVGAATMTAADANGTTHDGATKLLSASTQVTPRERTLFLSIFDRDDTILDSAVLLDNVVVGFVPDPSPQCKPGAQPQTFNLTLSPASATNPVGTSPTVTARLTEDGAPKGNAAVSFSVTGANTATGTATTVADRTAPFTYVSANAGTDTSVARYGADANGTCGNQGDPIASVTKTWEAAADTTKPTCLMTASGMDGAGKKYIDVTARDTGSGLKSIEVLKSTNATTVVPPFTAGTTDPVVVRATKINQSVGWTVQLRVTDVAANALVCDPAIIRLKIGRNGVARATVRGVPAAEGGIHVVNGRLGAWRVVITVNGARFETRMSNGAGRYIDVSSVMVDNARGNTLTLLAYGRPGRTVTLLVHD